MADQFTTFHAWVVAVFEGQESALGDLASDLAVDPHTGQLRAIAGSVPAAGRFPEGCVFRSRCWKATDQCRAEPPWTGAPHGPGYACWHPAQSEVIT